MPKKSPINRQSLKIPKTILVCGKFIANISPKSAILLAEKLFTISIKHSILKENWKWIAKPLKN